MTTTSPPDVAGVPGVAGLPAVASVAGVIEAARRDAILRIRNDVSAVLGRGCADEIGALSRIAPGPSDRTADFESIYADCLARAGGPVASAGLSALLIPGLFGKHYRGYMDENQQALAALGFQTGRAGIDTDGAVADNAAVLAQALADRPDRSVVVVAHSKGGVDLMAALALFPAVARALRAVVLLQSPLGGSPVATDLLRSPELARSANAILREVSAMAPAAVQDLTYASRSAFRAQHPFPPAGGPPVLCVASASHAPLAVTALVADYIELRYAQPSDGLVCPGDAVLPGVAAVSLQGLDHASSVIHAPGNLVSRYRPGLLTEAAVRLALTL